MGHTAFATLADRAVHVLGQLQHFNQICKLFHGKRIVVDTKVGEEQTGFLFFGAALIVHGMIRMEELNAARAELNKTTGEKPVTQKMFRAI